jgi:hypothetical protein
MNFTRDEFIKYLDNSNNAELVEIAFDAQRDLTDAINTGASYEVWKNAEDRKTLVKACLVNRMSK